MFENGRLYHPASIADYGLVKSKLADDLFARFDFGSDGTPTHFNWQDQRHRLTNELLRFDNTSSE